MWKRSLPASQFDDQLGLAVLDTKFKTTRLNQRDLCTGHPIQHSLPNDFQFILHDLVAGTVESA